MGSERKLSHSCLGGVHSFSTERLPRWGRGVLCMYSLRQSDTLKPLRQYDTMKKYLYVLNFAPLFKFVLFIKIQNIKANFA